MKAPSAARALVAADIRNWIASLVHAPKSERWRGIIFLFLLVAFIISAEFLAFRLFRAFLDVGGETFEFIALILTLRMLGLLFLIVFGLLFFGAMIASIDTLYFDDDIDFLASHPISRTAVMIKKYLSIYSTSAWVVFLIVTPVMAAYGRAIGVSLAHLPLSLFALFIFTLSPVALSGVVVMALMRFMPIDKAKEAVLAIGGLLSFGVVYLYRLLSPAQLFRPQSIQRLINDAQGFVREFTMPGFEALPSNVMAKALVAAAPLRYGPYFSELALLIGLAIFSVGAYLVIGGFFFETDRPVSGSAARPGMFERFLRLPALARFFARAFPRGMRGLFYKEVMTNARDPMQLSHLLLMVAIVVLHFLNLSEIPYGLHPAARVLVAFLNLGLVGFLVAGVAVRFIYPSISLEGTPYWLIESGPISPRRFLAMKFLSGWIPLTFASLIVVGVSNLLIGIGSGLMMLWLFATLAITTVVSAFGIATGATMPVFHKKNVFEISSSPGGIIFMLVSLLYVGSTIALLVAPTYSTVVGSAAMSGRAMLSIGIVGVMAVALTVVSWRIAVDGIETFAERRYSIGDA